MTRETKAQLQDRLSEKDVQLVNFLIASQDVLERLPNRFDDAAQALQACINELEDDARETA